MENRSKNILWLLLCIFIELILYIFLHEGGHALINILCGGRITSFSIFTAHVSSTGGNYNTITSSLLYAAGMLLPVMISMCFILFIYRQDKKSTFYHIFSFYFTIVPTGSILAWLLVPLLYLQGNAPASDDVTLFLNASGLSPVLILILALLLFLLNLNMMRRKKIIRKWWAVFNKN